MTLQVHDELVLRSAESEVDHDEAAGREHMEQAYSLASRVVNRVGPNWRDME